MNNSLISKYIPLNTIIHNLDPRAKIFFVILYLIDVFIAYNVLEFSILFLAQESFHRDKKLRKTSILKGRLRRGDECERKIQPNVIEIFAKFFCFCVFVFICRRAKMLYPKGFIRNHLISMHLAEHHIDIIPAQNFPNASHL